jgi:hypothetical protein
MLFILLKLRLFLVCILAAFAYDVRPLMGVVCGTERNPTLSRGARRTCRSTAASDHLFHISSTWPGSRLDRLQHDS